MDLTFQVPMQRCSLHHQDLLSLPDMFTTECYFHFDPVASFFLVLLVINCSLFFPHWTPSNLWSSSSGVINFCLCVLFMGFSQQEYWSGLSFSPPVDHVLLELFTMTRPFWVALYGMAQSFIELPRPLHHDKAVIHEEVVSFRSLLNIFFFLMFLTRASILFICGSYFISKILDHLYYHSSEFSFR